MIVSPEEIRGPTGRSVYFSFPRAEFQLGDRVLCISSDSEIPFGLRGTIVALYPRQRGDGSVDILFDQKFVRGTNLGGRCSALRGAENVPMRFLLNLTAHPNSPRFPHPIDSPALNLFTANPVLYRSQPTPLNPLPFERGISPSPSPSPSSSSPLRVDSPSSPDEKGEKSERGRGVCWKFQKGNCTRGNSCRFSHSQP